MIWNQWEMYESSSLIIVFPQYLLLRFNFTKVVFPTSLPTDGFTEVRADETQTR